MTPLVLIVGFLGAGKTTYLRRLLPALRDRGIGPHVVINDYQNARVDAELLRELADAITPISGSCVCCGSREELLAALETFDHAPNRVVVIETNGTTDAAELVELLSLEPALRKFTLPLQVSVIDARRWQKRFWHNELELAQTRTAGFVFVSRRDEVNERRAVQVEESLAARGVPSAHTGPEELASELAGIVRNIAHLGTRDALANPRCGCEHDDCAHVHESHSGSHAHRGHHFASLEIELPAIVSSGALRAFLDGLPDTVLRAKGVARLVDTPDEYHVFQRVDGGDTQLLPIGRISRVEQPAAILIGPKLDEDALRAQAARVFGTATGRLS